MPAFLTPAPLFPAPAHPSLTSSKCCRPSQPRFSMQAAPVAPTVAQSTPWLPSLSAYNEMYAASLADPDAFWTDIATSFHWDKSAPANRSESFFPPGVKVSWFADSRTNICYNAVDRWVSTGHGNRVALYCEGNDPANTRTVTYAEMLDMVQRLANVLFAHGVRKGDRVILYLPMVPELPAAMLACARIGAVHSVVFAGFSAEALAGRIIASNARVIVSSAGVRRARKSIPLKAIADEAIAIAQRAGNDITAQLVVPATEPDAIPTSMEPGRDFPLREELSKAKAECPVEWVEGEHPLFALYTSGSTGSPKGVVHSTAGYMLYTATTFKYAFDYHDGDVFFSTSDCGWITGHSYVTYGPLLNCATQVLYEGTPTFPDAGRLWEIIAKYRVAQLYTAPTAIRALKGATPPSGVESADAWVKRHDRSSLRILGTVGEPIDAAAWQWYHDVVGEGNCKVVDTWWQTETGGHCILSFPLPDLPRKPGCAMLPFFGIEPTLVDTEGNELQGAGEGILVLKRAWPAMLRTVLGDHERMEETYFTKFPGMYLTGDGARRDEDGHYWLTGRVDDVLSVSGHRIGSAEVEAAITKHIDVSEAAVVSVPHPVKGESIYAYVSVMAGVTTGDELKRDICMKVRKEIGAIATPDVVHWAPALPKTRSGKIMRRILRKIARDGKDTDVAGLGDISTLTDPGVVQALIDMFGI